MQTCKFFSNGSCKKGDKCKYKHVIKINTKQLNQESIEPSEPSQKTKNKKRQKNRKKKNTVNFSPSYEPDEMKVIVPEFGISVYNRPYHVSDVVICNDLFCKPTDLNIYDNLLKEIFKFENSDEKSKDLWKLWHGNSHLIADDNLNWKTECPTFGIIIEKLAEYFNMTIKATRFNWYRNSSEWKPYHHDAAAVKKGMQKHQNITVGVSFGAERDISFEHAKTGTKISFALPNGNVFAFGRDVNVNWRHGIPIVPEIKTNDGMMPGSSEGRISIIAWGWVDQIE